MLKNDRNTENIRKHETPALLRIFNSRYIPRLYTRVRKSCVRVREAAVETAKRGGKKTTKGRHIIRNVLREMYYQYAERAGAFGPRPGIFLQFAGARVSLLIAKKWVPTSLFSRSSRGRSYGRWLCVCVC